MRGQIDLPGGQVHDIFNKEVKVIVFRPGAEWLYQVDAIRDREPGPRGLLDDHPILHVSL